MSGVREPSVPSTGPRHDVPTRDAHRDRPADWAAPGAALVRSAPTDLVPALASLGRVHIMGIAGAGMSALARILIERGVTVTGCEARDSTTVAALRALGADVQIGHSPEHVDTTDTFVYTTAISPAHPEFVAARNSGKPFLRRAAALSSALEDRRMIAISGTHGKTTTTSLLTVAAQACQLDPSFAIGGNLYETGINAHLGTGDLAIVEADESDGSFLLVRPATAVVTNVEADHLENYGDLDGIFTAFRQFVDRIEANGLLVVSADDPGARRIAEYAQAVGRRVRDADCTDPIANATLYEIPGATAEPGDEAIPILFRGQLNWSGPRCLLRRVVVGRFDLPLLSKKCQSQREERELTMSNQPPRCHANLNSQPPRTKQRRPKNID